jgi:hypothetical protein
LNLIGTTAKRYKDETGLKPSTNIRDTFDEIKLAAIDLINLMAAKEIRDNNASSNNECVKVVSEVSSKVSSVLH